LLADMRQPAFRGRLRHGCAGVPGVIGTITRHGLNHIRAGSGKRRLRSAKIHGLGLTCGLPGLFYLSVLSLSDCRECAAEEFRITVMKTFLPKETEIVRKWLVIDADGLVLGRLASKVADVLRGKNKPTYTPHLDCGDFVVIINAEKVVLTGRKETRKIYESYSGYMGGQKKLTAAEVRAKRPARLIQDAVWGMLPKGRLGRRQYRKMKIYVGDKHPHAAQTPEPLKLA